MEIITFSAIKGGVGKTTLVFNYGEWLSEQGYNVLLFDTDHQCSLTQTYDIFKTTGTVADIFSKKNEVEIISIHENLSIIPASMDLDIINSEIQNKANREMLMYLWFSDNFDNLKQFDYVLIDCHPDFSTITQNMIIISDYVFSPIEPSEYGFISKGNLDLRMQQLKEDIINFETRQSLVKAELKFIGNRIKHNTKSSRDFVTELNKDKRTIAFFSEKELINKSTLNHVPLVKMKNDSKLFQQNKEFFNEIDKNFTKFTKL
ncbi:ParA family protein [Lactococcus lactis]|uniref:ParA family protein n=1 Tax=Lactococcus lactis TaxID=1358 RepID=UPI000D14CD68|nr:AAA family ATPase [Lactococcus lactis]PST73175.1 peptide transporter [Lactococcus garvieae]TYR21145.1 ParA family protein [Lactococcus lactis subsp. lactis bv. diacetylactis]